jgi:HEAT repeat protein
MIAHLCAVLLTLGPGDSAADPPPAVTARAEEKVLKALDAWLKTYRSGKIDFNDRVDILKHSIANKFGLLPKGMVGALTYRRELEIMLEQAAQLESAEAADVLLEVASTGLDQGKYTLEMAPHLVRDLGEKWVTRLKSAPARQRLVEAARGETRADRQRAAAIRAAALRALGTIGDPAYRTTLEEQLGNGEFQVRLAAADGLQRMGTEASAEPLIAALQREQRDIVIEALIGALRAGYARHLKNQKAGPDKAEEPTELPESSRLAVRAAIQALGRTTWRADMTLIAFLDDFRSRETVPALIDVLQRFKDRPEDVQSGKLSGLLLHRAHEVLIGMTGAVFPADRVDKWREFWEKEGAALTIATKRDAAARGPGTVSQGLFGIPVQGTRVVFIVDLSRSMTFAMPKAIPAGEVPDQIPSRLDIAKRELRRAVDGMPEVSSFNVVTFNGNPKAKTWSKDLLKASPVNKERFRTFVDDMRADGGTNLWAGLEEALKMKSLAYGDRYESSLDEVFIVSDGAPTVGDVVDPVEILRLVTETNRFSRVRINTIFITSPNEENPRGATMTPTELMQRLAEQNGGRFVEL